MNLKLNLLDRKIHERIQIKRRTEVNKQHSKSNQISNKRNNVEKQTSKEEKIIQCNAMDD